MILVTGATGILGRVIVLELLKQGKKVKATKRKNSNIQDVLHSYQFYTDHPEDFFEKIEWVDVDFMDLKSLENAMLGVTEVYHCAAKVSFNPKDKNEMYHTNIEGTKNLLYMCDNHTVEKFCFVSSIAVLDEFNENKELDENSEFNSKLPHSAYAKSKHFSEMEVWRSSAEGLKTIILNPGIIIGSGNWDSSSGEMFSQLLKSPYTTSGSSSYVDVRDVAKIAVSLMDQNQFGERFILISETKKMADVANTVRLQAGKSKAKILPDNLLQVGRIINLLFGWAFSNLKMMNKINIEAVTSHNVISNKKISTLLRFQFIPVQDSLYFHLNNYLQDKTSKS